MNNFGLNEKTSELLKDFFNKIPEIQMVKIYGSRAIGNYRKGSDIDFALFGDLNKNLVSKVAIAIDELNTPYMFDITNYNTIENENLKEHIDRIGKIFFERIN